jgi:hypothetical protein
VGHFCGHIKEPLLWTSCLIQTCSELPTIGRLKLDVKPFGRVLWWWLSVVVVDGGSCGCYHNHCSAETRHQMVFLEVESEGSQPWCWLHLAVLVVCSLKLVPHRVDGSSWTLLAASRILYIKTAVVISWCWIVVLVWVGMMMVANSKAINGINIRSKRRP